MPANVCYNDYLPMEGIGPIANNIAHIKLISKQYQYYLKKLIFYCLL